MSSVITFLTVSASCLFLQVCGSYTIVDDDNYRRFLKLAVERDPDTPLITLSNHRSLLDDPLLLSALLPYWLNCRPRYLRWGACAQELCFKEDNLLATFFGVGKSLPMWRGGGIDQPLLLQLARKTVGGGSTGRIAEWIHVYPEAGVFQFPDRLGGRSNGREGTLGKLKWGVAKIIAHNPCNKIPISQEKSSLESDEDMKHQYQGSCSETVRKYKAPIVIPFYFVGTETITPIDTATRHLKTMIPQWGHKVVVRFGAPIYFDDLVDDFLAKQQKGRQDLRVYHCCGDACRHSVSGVGMCGDEHNDTVRETMMLDSSSWKSTQLERQLYHRITLRAEEALQKLCDDSASIGSAK